jgi:predicted component of type VI protein secretion system
MCWDIEKMSAEIEPVLAEFEKRFSAPVKRTEVQLWVSSESDHTTTTIRKGAALLGPKEQEPTTVPRRYMRDCRSSQPVDIRK